MHGSATFLTLDSSNWHTAREDDDADRRGEPEHFFTAPAAAANPLMGQLIPDTNDDDDDVIPNCPKIPNDDDDDDPDELLTKNCRCCLLLRIAASRLLAPTCVIHQFCWPMSSLSSSPITYISIFFLPLRYDTIFLSAIYQSHFFHAGTAI